MQDINNNSISYFLNRHYIRADAVEAVVEMRTLTKQVLNELVNHIDVYETQGSGKNKTQRLVIYYKFVGYLDIDPMQCHPNYTADIRDGVAVEYVSCEPISMARHKEKGEQG